MKRNASLPKILAQQFHSFISSQMVRCMAHYNEPKLRQAIQRNFEWLEKFAHIHYESRIERAQDLGSKSVHEAQELSKRYIGLGSHDFFVTCVDGRNMPTVMFSKPPHVGGVLRAPAGAVTGFMEAQVAGDVFIDYESYVVQQIVTLLKDKAGDTIFYGLDSHLGCAARAQIHATEGGSQMDGGLRADILSKLMTARGILYLRSTLKESGEDAAEIIPTFFSYDPHSGGAVMGLEMHVNDEEVAKTGYTSELLDKLAKDGRIVCTLDLFKDNKVLEQLNEYMKPSSADFRQKYAISLLKNWQAITDLFADGRGYIYLKILEQLKNSYSLSGWIIGSTDSFLRRTISDRTLKQKAKFLLKNLVTRYSIAGTKEKWPYDTHQEEMAVITDGGYAPFSALDAFAVFSRDLNALLMNTKLTIDLIRGSRRSGKIKDPIKQSPLSPSEFIVAPVFISNKAILKGFKEESWKALESFRFDHIFSDINWDDERVLKWDKGDIQSLFMKIAQEKNLLLDLNDSLKFIDGVYELFNRMRIMMKDKYFRQMILHGNIVVFNNLVDHDRMPRLILRFVI